MKLRNKRVFWVVMLLLCLSAGAQEQKKENRTLFSLRYDNDIFNGTDRYYSFGDFVDFRRKLASNFILKKRPGDQLQLNFSLRQQGFTPDQLDETDVDLFDYPFAGWLSITSELARANESTLLAFAFEFGFTGDLSLAGNLQRFVHEFFNFEDIPTWTDQIPSSFLVNLHGKYAVDFASANKGAFLSFQTTGALGFKDIFIEEELIFSFGRRGDINRSSLFNNFGSKRKEAFGYLGVAYRYVAHNLLIEGSLFNNNAPFTLDANNNLLKIRLGGSFQIGRSILRAEYNFNTAENERSGVHDFMSFIFERSF